MTKLSVNINKIATIRNARGGNTPDLLHAAKMIQIYGGDGITVHPRPDERHVRFGDVRGLKPIVYTEFNIEGYPDENFLQLVEEVKPTQVTLVPDPPNVLTSNAGWDTLKHADYLTDIIARLHAGGMRVSVFLNPDPSLIASAAATGTDRIELYTESYAASYSKNRSEAIKPYSITAIEASQAGMGINAGHDLNLENLRFFNDEIPALEEVSIGHALISNALYLGLEITVKQYLNCLKRT